MFSATITSNGEITIPQEIREALHLQAGDRVSFRLKDNGVVEMYSETIDLIPLCGVLKPRVQGVTLEDIERAIAEGAGDQ
jgi:AbrB family looped-hinge helix DNA binding protein